MIHVAAGLFFLSMTCAVLSVVAILVPPAPDVDAAFVVGSLVAVGFSTALLWYVRRARL